MKKYIKKVLGEKYKNKKIFNIIHIENYLIELLKGYDNYMKKGGYIGLYDGIRELEKQQKIEALKKLEYNEKNPSLSLKWRIIKNKEIGQWDKDKFFSVADLLDLSYYERHPEFQTEEEWKNIKSIYYFLKQKESREWASIEERSLELFGYEKYITDNKNKKQSKILLRLGLKIENLKAIKYGEFFVHWDNGEKNKKCIFIVENHSTFFVYRRLIKEKSYFLNSMPQMIIFGEGKKIISSLSFLEEFVDPKQVKIFYFGDIDPEGWQIFTSLKERYPYIDMDLHYPSYIELLKQNEAPCKQRVNLLVCDKIIDLFYKKGYKDEAKKIEKLWNRKARIAQEHITYEYIKNLRCKDV